MPFDVELGMFFAIIDHRFPGLEGVVAMKLRRTPNRDRNVKLPHVGKYPSQDKQEQIFVATLAGEEFQVALHDRPLVRLSVGGMEQEVMLDTGSFTTIGNPAPGHTPRTDPTFKKAFEAVKDATREPNAGEPVLRIHGIGGGSLDCNEKGFLQCGPSSKVATKQIEVAFLPEHVPHMPRLLLGLPTILSAFEGLHIRIPKEGPFENNLMVTLGAFPDHPLQCLRRCDAIASMFEIKIENERNKPDFREERLESISDEACLAAARALLVAQKTACRDPSCAACNRKEMPKTPLKRKPSDGDGSDLPMSDAFRCDASDEKGQEDEEDRVDFRMPEMVLKFSAGEASEAHKNDFKGLLDSGATVSLVNAKTAAKFPSARRGKSNIKIRAADGGVTATKETIFLNAVMPNKQTYEIEFVVPQWAVV